MADRDSMGEDRSNELSPQGAAPKPCACCETMKVSQLAFNSLKRVAFTLAVLFVAGCSALPSAEDAQTLLRQRLDKGKDIRLRLVSFEKTDGRSMEFMGAKAYELMFVATAEFAQDALFALGGTSTVFGTSLDGKASEITTTEYRARTGGFLQDFSLNFNNLRPARAGDLLSLTGRVAFEQRESGWVSTGLSFAVEHTGGQALLGEWHGRMVDWRGELLDKDPKIRVLVARAGTGFRVVLTNLENSEESTLQATYREGVIQIEGRPEDYYKGHVPTLAPGETGDLAWWSEGIGNFRLTRK